jgi:alkylation response protein AidB-like acyl-CoA dehydrogenase
MAYRAPVDDYRFLLENLFDIDTLIADEKFAHVDRDLVEPILREAGRLCEDVLAPLRRAGDLQPAVLENGLVRTTPGFDDAFRQVAEGGWVGISAPAEFGGMQLPQTIGMAVSDMMSGANLALQLLPLLTQGQIEALQNHASDALKSLYLPKLISGEWSGTMNLTEPEAGSDVGALRTKAERRDDGTYAVSGQKIYITWADSDFLANTCHLVLGRLSDAPAGTKGISLFLVPKFIPDAAGDPGERNSLRVVSLEHKLGLHGSPTAVLEFDGATGWLVGEENGGMAAMFTMMNNARLGVGMQGVGVADAALQHAVAYAKDRKQGKVGGTGTIIEHADVRRMLTRARADVYSARAVATACAYAIDRSTGNDPDGDWNARAAFLTPIAKAFGTDIGIEVSDLGIQVHGGMGFVEESGAAQFLRDVRVTAIYEGTNGIQAADLVGRKFSDGGDAAFRLIDEIEEAAESARHNMPEIAQAVWGAAETLRETTEWMVARDDIGQRLAGSVPYLRAFARVLGAHYHLLAARAAGAGSPRASLAAFNAAWLLPEHVALLEQARQGNSTLFALSPDDLAA